MDKQTLIILAFAVYTNLLWFLGFRIYRKEVRRLTAAPQSDTGEDDGGKGNTYGI